MILGPQPEARMPQLKPEIHLLNIDMDKEAFLGTKSEFILTRIAQAPMTAVM